MKKVILFLALTGLLGAATSVTQNTITWTFDTDYPIGQYANGDYYVVAPSNLTIIGISPQSTLVSGRVRHGSMVNPTAKPFASNGFDSSLSYYSSTLNVGRPNNLDLDAGNPLVLPPGSSLISSRTVATAGARPQLSDAAVLTVVAVAPAAGDFRPPPYGTVKPGPWNKASLDYSILRNIPIPDSAPVLSTITNNISKLWLEIETQYGQQEWHPSNNMPTYGRDMATMMNRALNSLHLAYTNAEKEQLYINAVQYGIDIYGAAAFSQGYWQANGGHNPGRKAPLLLAARALGDANILAYADRAKHRLFQEDEQSFYVSAADVGKRVADEFLGTLHRQRLSYTSNFVGLPEWGITHTGSGVSEDGSNVGVIYRENNMDANVGTAIFAQLLPGGKADWNWPAFFDWADRAKTLTAISGLNTDLWPYRQLYGATEWVAPNPLAGYGFVSSDGLSFSIAFSQGVAVGAGGNGGLTITASGGVVTPTFVSSGSVSKWSLSRRIAAGEILTYSYTQPGDGLEGTTSGIDVPSVTDQPVKNYTCEFRINPDGLTGAWKLNSNVLIDTSGIAGLSITMSGGAVTLTSTGRSGPSVLLSFSRQITSSETGTWKYTPPSRPISNYDDKMGSFSSMTSLLNFSAVGVVADTTPPAYASTPAVDTITQTGFIVRAAINEPGTIYWGVYSNNATAPTSAQLKAGTGALVAGSAAAGTNALVSATITGRTAGTSYDVYVVAEDVTPNIQTTPLKVDVTTASAPVTPEVTSWIMEKVKKKKKGYSD